MKEECWDCCTLLQCFVDFLIALLIVLEGRKTVDVLVVRIGGYEW